MTIPVRDYWSLLARYLRPQRGRVWLLAGLLLLILAAQLVSPQVVRGFIDAAEGERPLTILWQGAAVFITIAIAEQILLIVATYVSEQVGWTATNRLREELALHCLKLDMGFHNRHTPGEMIERIDGDVNDLARFFSQFALVLLNNLLLLVGVLLLLWWEEWRVGLVMTLVAGLGLIALNYIRVASEPRWAAVRQASAELYGFLEERFQGREDIRANGLTDYVMRQLYQVMRRFLAASYRARWWQVVSLALPLLIFGLAYMATYWLSDDLYRAGGMSLGTVYLLFHYLGLLNSPMWQIVNEVQQLQQAGGSIGRIQGLLAWEDEERRARSEGRGARCTFPSSPFAVQFEDVTFAYADEAVLTEISFSLAAGRTLGLLGRTGSGKTTLTRLLLRFYEPSAGVVRLGGQDVRQMGLADLRRQVGMVTQEVQLFRATVRANLTFFDVGVADGVLTAVIHQLGLTEWFNKLPDGLDTIIDAGSLSAGEAQLLALVRVFLQDPGLIILDEASSRLDPATERLMARAVRRLLQGRTAIIIAHRLETVQWVDEVMVLANGRMLEHGERERLANDPDSLFASLVRKGNLAELGGIEGNSEVLA
ncbi:MAG: ABC transporter ATP-binding protein [Ardenticatenaceae bacterium]|nr:ABC transporter ATP-binding protein [Ardenticatenaceae bacterium]